jgi:hypothetical protein
MAVLGFEGGAVVRNPGNNSNEGKPYSPGASLGSLTGRAPHLARTPVGVGGGEVEPPESRRV